MRHPNQIQATPSFIIASSSSTQVDEPRVEVGTFSLPLAKSPEGVSTVSSEVGEEDQVELPFVGG